MIPARGGSKRLPGKNTKAFAGKPLIAHTIEVALESGCCKEVVVSTDCFEIAKVATEYGASVPWMRPESLAQDNSDVCDAIIDTLEKFQEMDMTFDSVLLLQPTSPFRSVESIQKAVELHNQSGCSVVSVSPLPFNFSWCRAIDNQGNLQRPDFLSDKESHESLFKLNGVIYLASAETILSNRSLYSEPTKALLLDRFIESIDIDTPIDWAIAEKMLVLKREGVV
ncbi:CMP-N-acetlyneuraminic acid synthetase [Legionella waltersii]|uniref:CMP-N-acetlyneuraminic acid synthetase n=2 Tax=Legionella waltersii TaxID=66969 RepID=A0A0W1AMZ1_9GAMM|nr:CMP-N-acetlyneuraminic acid synthetase [Legionella waltersii]SNV00931.1 N-acylneuraminate cytidylyltransferase [Legionella waltersii]